MSKNILDEFERKTIELHNYEVGGVISVPVWCYGELFTVQSHLNGEPVWGIGCIPRGCMFPYTSVGLFRDIEDACAVMKEMVRINNNWAGVERFGVKMLDQLKALSDKHNAIRDIQIPADSVAVNKPFLNGTDRRDYA